MRVVKRDGSLQELQMTKVQRAIAAAFADRGGVIGVNVAPLTHNVMNRLLASEEVEPYSIELISDLIEAELFSSGHDDVARSFVRYRLEREALRAKRLIPDPDAISEYIHVGKYARYREEWGRRELFNETIDRDEQMHVRRWPHLEAEIKRVFGFVRRKETMPSMRSMQFGGKAIEKHNARTYNCSFTHIDRWRAFQEAFFLLLCGCGVGYSVQWRHIEKLSELQRIDRKKVLHWTVADSIEGWADALGTLIDSYTVDPLHRYVEFDYSQIRPEGTPLKTSGGLAPGHLPLKEALEQVRLILDAAQGRKLRPLEAHDILCFVAEAVLAGGIRRSSLISIFSAHDTEMLYCKARGQFRPAEGNDPGLNSHRQMANNSAALLRGKTDRALFERIIRVAQENYGDPGFYWTDNLDYGPNPCGEIGMWPVLWEECGCDEHTAKVDCSKCNGTGSLRRSGFSFCNLTEVNCAVSMDAAHLLDQIRAAAFVGTLQAAYTQFEYLGEITEKIVRRDALLGVGLTGIMDNRELVLDPVVLRMGASVAVAENKRVAKLIGIRPAARVTTVKPSGTASLELGAVGSGIHPRWARRYIQRVTANENEPQAIEFRRVNPHMVEVKPNGDWCLLFPIQAPDHAVTVKEMPALEFMDAVFMVYENWICGGTADASRAPGLTHNVSCTVTVRDGELEEVVDRIWENQERIAAMSFVPYLIDQKFRYAPRQAIVSEADEALWNNLIRLYKPVEWGNFKEERDTTTHGMEPACSGGVCEVQF